MKTLKSLILIFFILLSALPSCASDTTAPQTVTVHFIDVGQGDAIVIDYGQTEVLIDAGEKTPGVVNYLHNVVDGDLEVMVATHTDADHIGGLADVLQYYKVDDIWVSGHAATSKTFKNFMTAVYAEGAAVHQATLGDKFEAGGLTFNVLNPPAKLFSGANNNSVVLSFSFDDVDFLFTGDAEKEAEKAMLTQTVLPVPDVDILKVGHHGSRSASSPDFLDVVRPETAIYMCALDNDYKHPHIETINSLTAIGATIYGTENYGTIKIITDGKTYTVQTEKKP